MKYQGLVIGSLIWVIFVLLSLMGSFGKTMPAYKVDWGMVIGGMFMILIPFWFGYVRGRMDKDR